MEDIKLSTEFLEVLKSMNLTQTDLEIHIRQSILGRYQTDFMFYFQLKKVLESHGLLNEYFGLSAIIKKNIIQFPLSYL